jgi:hypothetical protein
MTDSDDDLLILQGKKYWKQPRWSRDRKVHVRTTERHRQLGLPWMYWGGEIYIPEDEGDAYIAGRLKRRNPPRRRRQAAPSREINAA